MPENSANVVTRNKRVTAHDVARTAGVSQATVSYVLSGRSSGQARISERTRERVLGVVAELGYVPNQTARNLRRRRTERICLVAPSLGVPYFDLMAEHIQQAAGEHGYSVVIAVAGSALREQQILNQLRRGLADGVIFVAPSFVTAGDLTALARTKLAVVVLSNHIVGSELDIVRTTERESCHDAVGYLLDRGHRRIAFLGNCSGQSVREQRLAGYRAALLAAGIAPGPELELGTTNSRERAYRRTLQLLDLTAPPTAIFAASDMAALSAIAAVRDRGLRVPDEIAVIGVGNIPEGSIMQPALTTVGVQVLVFDHISELLFGRIAGEQHGAGRTVTEQWQLIRRASA